MDTYYKLEFQNLLVSANSNVKRKQSSEHETVTFDQLLQWSDLKQVMADFQLSRDDIRQLYLDTVASTATTSSSNKGFSSSNRKIQVNESEFVRFNRELESYLQQIVPPAPVDWDTASP